MYCEHFEESLWESCSFRHVMIEGQRKSLESPTGLELNIFQVPGWLSLPGTFLQATERTEARLVKSKLISYVTSVLCATKISIVKSVQVGNK